MMPEIKKEQLNHCLEIIHRTVKKAGQVSESLLTFARKNESVKAEGRLEKTIEDVLLILEKSFKLDNVKIKAEIQNLTFYLNIGAFNDDVSIDSRGSIQIHS